jgi:hypothetical protein
MARRSESFWLYWAGRILVSPVMTVAGMIARMATVHTGANTDPDRRADDRGSSDVGRWRIEDGRSRDGNNRCGNHGERRRDDHRGLHRNDRRRNKHRLRHHKRRDSDAHAHCYTAGKRDRRQGGGSDHTQRAREFALSR